VEAVGGARAFGNQLIAVVAKELEVHHEPLSSDRRQVTFPCCHPRYGERVRRIRLAALPQPPPLTRRETCRNLNGRFSRPRDGLSKACSVRPRSFDAEPWALPEKQWASHPGYVGDDS
jgi:hypothetical protein